MDSPFFLYGLVLLQALTLSLALTPLAMGVARRTGYLDHPGHRKVHSQPKPLLGGAAIFLSFYVVLLGNLALLFLLPSLLDRGDDGMLAWALAYQEGVIFRRTQLIGFLLGGLVIFIVGMVDDKRGLGPAAKIAGQVVAGLILFACGIQLTVVDGLGVGGFILALAGTVGWVVLLSNSFNLLDNMDGLSAGVAVIVLGFFAVVAHLLDGQTFMVTTMCALIGAILGFLRYNFHPSRIFMGDAGSMFIGYCIASLTLLSTYFIPTTVHTRLAVLIPLVVMAVPLFDTISVIVIRLRNGAPILMGDKNHFSHRLVALGFSHRNAVLMIYLVTACTGLVAVVMPRLPFSLAMLLLVQVVLVFAIIALLEHVKRH